MLKTMALMTLMAMQYQNAPYRWGANGPFEFDCSGLALKVLKDVGISLTDRTSQNLYNTLKGMSFSSCEPEHDCILFFGKSIDKITHVSIGISPTLMIEAGGAGRNSLNMTMDQLAAKDARVRLSKINRRRDLVASIKVRY
jgi:cell wall-associated NlpC family hydrolase